MSRAKIVAGRWERNVPWGKQGIWRSDIFKTVLADKGLKEAVFLCHDGPVVTILADELRHVLVGGASHYEDKIWGPFNIDPSNKTIDGKPVAMSVHYPAVPATLPNKQPNYYLKVEDYFQLTGPGFWQIKDAPVERLKELPQFPPEKTIAVFASGVAPHIIPKTKDRALGGIDWIRFEKNPAANEPSINVDHYIIGPSGANGFPVWGPYKRGAIADHWPTGKDPFKGYFES
jgi:hypothetical protein